VAGYKIGKTMKELAAEFGINRVTVSKHLRRAGVAVRGSGLAEVDACEAAALYAAGWSAARIAERFGVCVDTVLRSLRATGVEIRPPVMRPTAGPKPAQGALRVRSCAR
jgi:transposase-like protein